MKAPVGGGKFELAPEGTHAARIYSLVDIGVQKTNYGDKQQIIITWELVDTKMEDGQPFVISRWYTLSLAEKANLRKDIKNMTGKGLSDEKARDFDLAKLLNLPCQIVVIHEEKDGKDKAIMQAIIPPTKGQKVSDLSNQTVIFDTDEIDQAVYDSLPDWQKERINLPAKSKAKGEELAEVIDDDDDIPWDE